MVTGLKAVITLQRDENLIVVILHNYLERKAGQL